MSWYYQRTQAIETDEGIKARSKQGTFAENWWAERWIKTLEQITDAGRLRRGRTYARKGQVLAIEEKKGEIQAKVQGSRPTPYTVTIRLAPLSTAQWDAVLVALGERAIFTAQLLAGEMPHEIEEAFAAAGVSLLPQQSQDLTTTCSCPDWANPCKHVAATHYILGEQFDHDPFLIFRLRGRNQEQIFAALRSHRQTSLGHDTAGDILAEMATPYAADETVSLEEHLDNFWRMGSSLEHFPTSIQAPITPLPVLRRLGEPPFLDQDLASALRPLYETISQRAQQEALHADKSTDLSEEEE
jgi:uncharacterized Zn finger protein